MKIKLDRTLCDGFGTCAVHAPNTFSLDEWGYVSLIGAGNVAEADEDGVRRAVLDCPVHAIFELDPAGVPAGSDAMASQVGSSSPRTVQAAAVAGQRLVAHTSDGARPRTLKASPFS